METSKSIFLRDKPLADWLHGIVQDARFEKCLAFADGELINMQGWTPDKMQGAREYKRILLTLSEADANKRRVIPPLLDHNFDKPPPKRQTKEKVTKK